MLYTLQIGKEHVGLKAVTEILQDIQYKVSHSLKENKTTGCVRGFQAHLQSGRFPTRTHSQVLSLLVVVSSSGRLQSRRGEPQASRQPRPVESHRDTPDSPGSDVTTGVKHCQPGKLSWALVSRDFIGGQSCQPAVPEGLTSATLTLALPHPEQNRAFTINPSVGIYLSGPTGAAWPKASGTQSHSSQTAYSKGSESVSQEPARGQSWRQAF